MLLSSAHMLLSGAQVFLSGAQPMLQKKGSFSVEASFFCIFPLIAMT